MYPSIANTTFSYLLTIGKFRDAIPEIHRPSWVKITTITMVSKFLKEIAPAPGHHGFRAYGGQLNHYLHHKRFEVNYGGSLVPMDHLFGTLSFDDE